MSACDRTPTGNRIRPATELTPDTGGFAELKQTKKARQEDRLCCNKRCWCCPEFKAYKEVSLPAKLKASKPEKSKAWLRGQASGSGVQVQYLGGRYLHAAWHQQVDTRQFAGAALLKLNVQAAAWISSLDSDQIRDSFRDSLGVSLAA
jgi:hypothetical protein